MGISTVVGIQCCRTWDRVEKSRRSRQKETSKMIEGTIMIVNFLCKAVGNEILTNIMVTKVKTKIIVLCFAVSSACLIAVLD